MHIDYNLLRLENDLRALAEDHEKLKQLVMCSDKAISNLLRASKEFRGGYMTTQKNTIGLRDDHTLSYAVKSLSYEFY